MKCCHTQQSLITWEVEHRTGSGPVTERLLRRRGGRGSCEGDGVALRPNTVPASLALVPSMLALLSAVPSASTQTPHLVLSMMTRNSMLLSRPIACPDDGLSGGG